MFKLYMKPLNLLVITLACDLKQTFAESAAKTIVKTYIREKNQTIKSSYRLYYHVAAPVGWINYPNGFSYHKGEYHLFYQFYPYDSHEGPLHWGHMVSPNLVDWVHLPTTLVPDNSQYFSDCTVYYNPLLMDTESESTIEEPVLEENQNLESNDDTMAFHKYGNLVLAVAPNGSIDLRDPKVRKHGDHRYDVLERQTEDTVDETGYFSHSLLYRYSNIIMNWEFLSVHAESTSDLGYKWKYTDLFELNGKHVLLLYPLGMDPQGDRYKNVHQAGYIIGSYNNETFEFLPDLHYQELDFGHDFYAAQTTAKDGKRYLIAWFEGRDEDVDGWSGALTTFRELELVGYRLVMKPVEAMINLREKTVWDGDIAKNLSIQFNKTGELLVSANFNKRVVLEIKGSNGGEQVSLRWNPRVRKVVVDREGDIRQMEWLPLGSKVWRIFLDTSSLELFCGEGEVVFSTRVYSAGSWQVTNLSPQVLNVVAYTLWRSVPE
ncbi:hypothetical protein PYW08_016236 [Mythimna loreyi]|uniref:Uncharacterized protein n=1 Tax=Mythimna loreyi TaxID=667449 RepID=A0ACC2QX14_9NEOP|nr:hypothetical protein PYW08_016236 [Mythimna loreyi]